MYQCQFCSNKGFCNGSCTKKMVPDTKKDGLYVPSAASIFLTKDEKKKVSYY